MRHSRNLSRSHLYFPFVTPRYVAQLAVVTCLSVTSCGSTAGLENKDSESSSISDSQQQTDGDENDESSECSATKRAPSQSPPCAKKVGDVPLFVSLGFDDNSYSGLDSNDGGVQWVIDMMARHPHADGSPAHASFYFTSTYIGDWLSESPVLVKRSWHAAQEAGHELGNHTHSHNHGDQFSQDQWTKEIQTCLEWLEKPFSATEDQQSPDASAGVGFERSAIRGFRTPFLEYNDATLSAVQDLGFEYDCSIEDGWQDDQDPTNYFWPYTLDQGSPGHEVLVQWESKEPITPHPGLWEMPVHPVVAPPDELCPEYGIQPGLRSRLKAIASWFDESSGKITGFDYNLWVSFKMSPAEFLGTLKYTFDLRLQGNRAPFMFGVHSDYYSDKYTAPENATPAQRRQALEDFVAYVSSVEAARIAPVGEVLDWVKKPTNL